MKIGRRFPKVDDEDEDEEEEEEEACDVEEEDCLPADGEAGGAIFLGVEAGKKEA